MRKLGSTSENHVDVLLLTRISHDFWAQAGVGSISISGISITEDRKMILKELGDKGRETIQKIG